jgi:hypothetical protein
MRKSVLVLLLLFAFVLLLSSPAAAQPTQGFNSTEAGEDPVDGRNAAGYGGGPHCHVLIRDTSITVFPSHRGHERSGFGHIFTPTQCET